MPDEKDLPRGQRIRLLLEKIGWDEAVVEALDFRRALVEEARSLLEALEEADESAKKWRVLRQSGRGRMDEWRTLWEGDDEAVARAEYKKAEDAMRQGAVMLRRPDGRTEFVKVAPRVRTRW